MLTAALVIGFCRARGAKGTAEEDGGAEAPRRVVIENGETVVLLDAASREASGVGTEALAPASQPEEIRGYGAAVDLRPLAELRSTLAAARAAVAKAAAQVEAARREHRRVEVLFRDNRNMSAKALDEATGRLREAEAARFEAEAAVRSSQAAAGQEWGPVIAGWLMRDSPALARLLARQDILVQVTVPPDQPAAFEATTAQLEVSPGSRVAARFLSAAGRTDPRLQGASAFYVAPGSSGLLPGMTFTAYLPSSREQAGAVVPESAIVSWQGKSWAYVVTAPGRYVRREVKTDVPARGGGYVVADLPAGTEVVVRGAQMLLSEELRAQIQVGEE